MKSLRLLMLLALVCGLSVSALGNTFHVKVLDPDLYQIQDTGPQIDFLFTNSCPISLQNAASPSPTGCIAVENDTLGTFTSLSLTFSDVGLPGETAACDQSPFFASDNCAADPSNGTFTLTFSGIPGVSAGTPFLIEETGVAIPDACSDANATAASCGDPFGNVTATVTDTALTSIATPEPNSFVLLGTGIFLAGALLLRKRLFPNAAEGMSTLN
jgi:hypothetical protein